MVLIIPVLETDHIRNLFWMHDFNYNLCDFKIWRLGYQREVQNFNADLIEREIVMNHYGLNYNLSTNFNLGWYTQVMHTRQTDANTRNLDFYLLIL